MIGASGERASGSFSAENGRQPWVVIRSKQRVEALAMPAALTENAGEPLTTAGGGNFVRGEVNRNEQAPQCGAATIEVAEMLHE